jgi:hypothetical protein
LDVLVEGADSEREGRVVGTSCRYAPVSLPGLTSALLARLVPVRAERVQKGVILGEPLAEEASEAGDFRRRQPAALARRPLALAPALAV